MTASQRDAFDVMADALDAMAQALLTVSSAHGDTPLPASAAARENADGVQLKEEWSSNPVLDANLAASLLVSAATDHAQSLAAVLRMDSSGIFTTYTVARGLLENGCRAWHLLEPGISPRERVRRHVNERLYSLNEARLLLEGADESAAHQIAQEEKVIRSAKALSFNHRHRKGWTAACLMPKRESVMELAGVCMSMLAGQRDLGATSYRLLSAQAHGTAYGLMQVLGPPATAREATGPATTWRQVQHSSNEVGMRLLAPVFIYTTMAQRYVRHYGWEADAWQASTHAALKSWINCMQAPPAPAAPAP